jgi:isopenicillin N synthase-like dioxygenase
MITEIIENSGFFYIDITNDEKKIIEDIMNITKNYFTMENKDVLNSNGLGYAPLGRVKFSKNSDIIEMKESFTYRKNEIYFDESILLDKYIDFINKKGKEIFIKIMKELEIKNYDIYIEEPYITLSLIHYPINNNTEYGIYPHTDWGFLTFLYTNEEGLQIKMNNKWIDIPIYDNKLIINIGDMLEVVTAGKYKSTIHQVINKKKEKYSIVCFFEPNKKSIIKPYNNENIEIEFKTYITNKLQETYFSKKN